MSKQINALDLVHLNLQVSGGTKVGAELTELKNKLKDLEFAAEGIKDQISDQKKIVAAAGREISNYSKEIDRQKDIADKAADRAAKYQAKLTDLEEAGKSGSAQWTLYNGKMNEQISIMEAAKKETGELSLAKERAKKYSEDERKTLTDLQTDLKGNTKAQADNKQAIVDTAKQMKISEMSYNQLRSNAAKLRNELANTSKALEPEKWNRLNNELIATEKQQDKVAAGAAKVKSKFDDLGNTIKKTLSLMVAYKVLQFFTDLLGKAADWIKAAPEVAAKTEGISRAFDKLNSPSLLKTLRAETKGLISDVLLMQSSVKADRFGIPINNLAKYLKFAQQRAQETGESVDYLTESIINGIGRKSPLILDNLGISAARLKAEMAGGATIVQATTKIVNEELAKQGDLALTSADKAKQASVKWENAQVAVGKRMTWLSDLWSKVSGNMADKINQLAGDTRSANDAYTDQLKKVADLKVNIDPLIGRYEELSKKVKINYTQTGDLTEEQIELRDVTGQIAAAIPSAVTALDSYGRAMSVNTITAREYIRTQAALLKYFHADAIKDFEKQRSEATRHLNRINAIFQSGYETSTTSFGDERVLNQTTLEKNSPRYNELLTELNEWRMKWEEANNAIRKLDGTTAEEEAKIFEKRAEQRNAFNKMDKKQLKAWIDNKKNANSEYLELAREVYSAQYGGDYGSDDETASKKLAKQKQELERQLTVQENSHKLELQSLKDTKIKERQTDEEYKIIIAKSDKKFYAERISLLNNYRKKVSDKSFIADIDKKIADTKGQQQDIDPIVDSATLSSLSKRRDEELKAIDRAKNAQIRSLAELELSEQQYSVRVQAIELATAQMRLEVLNNYSKAAQDAEIADGRMKAEAVRDAGDAIVAAEIETIQKRKAIEKSFRDDNYNIRNQAGLTTSREQMSREQAVFHDEMLAGKISYEDYQRALTKLNEKYETQRIQTKEQYGIASTQEIYDMELAALEAARERENWTEEEYDKAKWNLKLDRATKFAQKISAVTSAGVSAISALMEAETAKLDAEYDMRIEAAKGNSEETERLENEKAQKKLDIEKKYADVQFAVKASDIIANTAVAIMTGYAQLGPIAGSIAAAMLGITGAAQLAIANAERDKVKNMTLGGSASSTGTGQIVAGREQGGYMDVTREQDGKRFSAVYDPDRRGFVDRPTVIVGEGPESREWVASNAANKNPTIAPIIGLIDEAQRNGTVSTIDMNQLIKRRLAGYESGGFFGSARSSRTSANASTPSVFPIYPDDNDIYDELLLLLRQLRSDGVVANIGATELQAELDHKRKIDDMFTMKD